MRNLLFAAFILFGVVTAAASVHADSKNSNGKAFIGIEYLHQDIEMKTEFIRRTGGVITEHSGFYNPYTSSVGGLFGGYTLPFGRAYLSGRVYFNIFNDKFRTTAGSSSFLNELNYAYGIDLMPGVYLYRGLSLFGKIGLGGGNFDFVKTSPTSTTYDVNAHLLSYTLGLGFAYDITQRFTVKIGIDRIQYDETEINAALGLRSDKTLVEPETNSFYLSLQYNF